MFGCLLLNQICRLFKDNLIKISIWLDQSTINDQDWLMCVNACNFLREILFWHQNFDVEYDVFWFLCVFLNVFKLYKIESKREIEINIYCHI